MRVQSLPLYQGFAPADLSGLVNLAVVEDHVDLACSLWQQRAHACGAANYNLADLAYCDDRLEANLQGIAIAERVGLRIATELLDASEPSAVFVLASTALRSGSHAQFDALVASLAEARPACIAAFVDSCKFAMPAARVLLERYRRYTDSRVAALVLDGLVGLRQDPGQLMDRALRTDEASLLCSGAWAVGTLGLLSHQPQLYPLLQHPHVEVRIAAAFSVVRTRGALRGEGLALLEAVASTPEQALAPLALSFVLRGLGDGALERYERMKPRLSPWLRHWAAAATGNPAVIPELLRDCENPAIACSAGNAISVITGVDLAYLDLDMRPAVRNVAPPFAADPTQVDVEEVTEEPGQDHPMPHAELLAAWWASNAARFPTGRRYLGGLATDREGLAYVLRTGTQQMRAAAALELALIEQGALLDTAAPGFLQTRRFLGWTS